MLGWVASASVRCGATGLAVRGAMGSCPRCSMSDCVVPRVGGSWAWCCGQLPEVRLAGAGVVLGWRTVGVVAWRGRLPEVCVVA